jgi:DNA-binding NarL/FixJ family response regulator
MKTSTSLLAIYDDNKLLCQLMHHGIERLGFAVAFSCAKKETLYENLKCGSVPSLLLMSADHDWKKTLKVMKHVKFLNEKIEAIIYLCKESNTIASEFIKAGAKSVIVNCSIQRLVDSLDTLFPMAVKPVAKKMFDDDEAFNTIIKNEKYIKVLQGMAASKSNEDIGKLADLTASTVETYKKRIRVIMQCKTCSEAVGKAKDYGII